MDEIPEADDPLHGLPYRALRRLGGGGMGEVFLAQHRKLGKQCAVKILHERFAGDKRLGSRVLLEARVLGNIDHPNVVSVSGAGYTFDSRPFIVTEFLEGRTVADEMEARGRLSVLEALTYTGQALRALAATHARGVIHRDIKPGNLFLCDGADGDRTLKVIDFGLTRVQPDAPADAPRPLTEPTDIGLIVGTPRYISPEGACARPVDHRADLYGAALVLYLMVTGRGPFDDIRSEALLLSAHALGKPPPPSHFTKYPIPPELDRVILHALRKDPNKRFQTADAFRAELEQIKEKLERTLCGSDASEIDVSLFAHAPRSATNSARGVESRDVMQTSSPRAWHYEIVSVPIPSSGAQPAQLSPSRQKHSQRPITNLRVALIFLSALVASTAATATIIAQFRGVRVIDFIGSSRAGGNDAAPH